MAPLPPSVRSRPWRPAAASMFGVGWGANQFASLLVAYELDRHLTTGTAEALFGVYALGLIPALLVCGPLSDRIGRRRIVRPGVVLSVGATVVLMAGDHSVAALYGGRFLAGVCSGALFAAGTAWVKELSVPPHDTGAGEQTGARRAAIALSAGFGLGPVVAAVVAQWSPAPLVVAYLPHLVVMAVVIPLVWTAPETVPGRVSGGGLHLSVPAPVRARFAGVVVPVAPWVFVTASVSFAVLPTVGAAGRGGAPVAFAGLMAGVTLAVGVAIQPLARRLDTDDDARGAMVGLGVAAVGLVLAAVAAGRVSWPLALLAAATLGAGYGLCLVSGLLEVQRLASGSDLAALTALFYSATYVGFAAPIVLTTLSHHASYATLLRGGAVLALVSLAVVAATERRHPRRPVAPR